MTDTRKKIIRLLEPYMNKTLSKGVLLSFIENVKHGDFVTFNEGDIIALVHEDTKYEHCFDCSCYRGPAMFHHKIFDKLKIIGHYTLDAVLKYLESFEFCYYKTMTLGRLCFYEKFDEANIIKIPNKPLTLYTDEEEKKLLFLLERLCNKGKK